MSPPSPSNSTTTLFGYMEIMANANIYNVDV